MDFQDISISVYRIVKRCKNDNQTKSGWKYKITKRPHSHHMIHRTGKNANFFLKENFSIKTFSLIFFPLLSFFSLESKNSFNFENDIEISIEQKKWNTFFSFDFLHFHSFYMFSNFSKRHNEDQTKPNETIIMKKKFCLMFYIW